MERNLVNKTAIITGGAEGIGFAIAKVFLQKGAKAVILLDINEKLGISAAKDLNSKFGDNRAVYIKCDVTTDLEPIYQRIIDMYKTIDILVNNAGVFDWKEIDNRRTINVNIVALVEWTKKLHEHMRKDRGGNGGTIINVSSIAGYGVRPFFPVYHATKYAAIGFTTSIGHSDNYNKYGVRVLAICPGITETNFWKGITVAEPLNEKIIELKNYEHYGVRQTADAVGRAAAEVFDKAESGTVWEIQGDKPVMEVKTVIEYSPL